jgi:hypothetical protein
VGSLVAAQERAREQAERPRRVPRFVVGDASISASGSSAVDEAADLAGGDAGAASGGRRRRLGFGDEQAFQAAKAAADLRAAQYRAAFLEQARLSPVEQTAFDETVRSMNDELAQAADELAEVLGSRGRRLSPRDVADIGARVLDVYRRADDRFKGGLHEAGQAALERTDFDILTQIDLGAFRRLGDAVETLGVSESRREP